MKLCDNDRCGKHSEVIKVKGKWRWAGGFECELDNEQLMGSKLEFWQDGKLVKTRNYCYQCAGLVRELFSGADMTIIPHERV